MEDSKSPVVVIGAGVSGLVSIKACLEDKLPVVCFEKTNCLGGLWVFREKVEYGVSSVMKSTIINSSKEMSAFSDFPPPQHLPNYMHNTQLARYLAGYAEKFDLAKHIRYHHEVLSLTPAEDFQTSGCWMVQTRNKEGEVTTTKASAVMVCTGHHVFPHCPEFPGLKDFEGDVIHTHSYKDFNGYQNKKVLVVGIGNSGGDVAVELNRIASQVFLSTRRGTWVMNRVGEFGLPVDTVIIRRFITSVGQILPYAFSNWFLQLRILLRFNHKLYQLQPDHYILSQHIFVNDDLPNCILAGTVAVKSDIDHFTPNGVVFKKEPGVVYNIDSVVLATGYEVKFPFIDDE